MNKENEMIKLSHEYKYALQKILKLISFNAKLSLTETQIDVLRRAFEERLPQAFDDMIKVYDYPDAMEEILKAHKNDTAFCVLHMLRVAPHAGKMRVIRIAHEHGCNGIEIGKIMSVSDCPHKMMIIFNAYKDGHHYAVSDLLKVKDDPFKMKIILDAYIYKTLEDVKALIRLAKEGVKQMEKYIY